MQISGATQAPPQSGWHSQVQAVVLTAFVVGQLQRFTRSGFRRVPTDKLDACLSRMLFIA